MDTATNRSPLTHSRNLSNSSRRPAVARALTIAALLAGAHSASADIVNLIADSEMPDADYSTVLVGAFGGFSGSAMQAPAGGNPGAYRAISHSSTLGQAGGSLVHTHAATWTPALSGAINSIDMRLDVNCFNGGTSNAVGFGLLVVQDGVPYYGPTFTPLSNSGWRVDLQATGLIESDFISGPSHPDFSATGSTIAFGFFSSNGTSSGTPISSTSGADNFFVTLAVTPSCAGDVNGDGFTNSADFNILAGNFGSSVPPNTSGDLTGDGLVNSADFNVFAGDFGCGS